MDLDLSLLSYHSIATNSISVFTLRLLCVPKHNARVIQKEYLTILEDKGKWELTLERWGRTERNFIEAIGYGMLVAHMTQNPHYSNIRQNKLDSTKNGVIACRRSES